MKTKFELAPRLFSAFVIVCLCVSMAFSAETNDYWVYFGTSTGPTTPEQDEAGTPRSEGIYVGKFDASTGAISTFA